MAFMVPDEFHPGGDLPVFLYGKIGKSSRQK
jgi:hypothetical protein